MELFEGRDVFEQNRARWEDLLGRSGEAAFFLSSDWLTSWARTTSMDRRMFLAANARDGSWVAGLPMTLSQGRIGRIPLAKLEIAGAPWFDSIELPAATEVDAADFVRALLAWCSAELRGWTAFELRELSAEGPTAAAVERAARELGMSCDRRVCSRAPIVRLADLAGGEAALSKNLRSQLRRSAKRLNELGTLDVRFELPEPERMPALLAECAEIERASWKGRTKSGALQPESGWAFFADVCPRLARERRVALGTLYIDGRLCAYHLGFKDRARFLSYNLAQRPEVDAVGPGTYLLQGMLERGSALGFDVFDASRGSLTRPHSLVRYSGAVREHVQLVLYNRNASGKLVALAKRHLFPGIKRLAQRFAARSEES